jgi:alanyl-tRNA synthetase
MSLEIMKKYWENALIYSFEARVESVIQDENRLGIVFDETYFYPEGGGQPSDRGTIAGFPVIDVQELDDQIIHYLLRSLETETILSKGSSVLCEIDRDYRFHNMRLHTTAHILFGAARKLFTDLGYAGFKIGDVGNLYLETNRQIRSDDLREMAQLANEVVVEGRPVTAYFTNREDAKNIKGLAYNIDLPNGKVRIIEVAGWDIAACSGTHVSSTLDIGPIKVVTREIHKKGVTRIDYAVGKRAVAEMTKEDKVLTETAEFLTTSKESVYSVIKKISGDLQAVQKDLRKARENLMDYRIQEFQQARALINDVCLIVDVVVDADPDELKTMVTKLLSRQTSTLVALIGGSENISIVSGCTPDLKLVISQPIMNIGKKYGGKGGGRPNFVIMGGIQCNAISLKDEIYGELVKLILPK